MRALFRCGAVLTWRPAWPGRRGRPETPPLHVIAVAALALVAAAATALSAQDVRPSFSEWLAGVRSEAIARGVKPEIVDEALAGVEEPLPVILERDRAQAEAVQSIETYLAKHVTPAVIRTARQMFEK